MRFLLLLASLAWLTAPAAAAAPTNSSRWWKGNLHTHSYWSDGDDYPEMIADWYKTNGYHFLAISDHNNLQNGRAWVIPGYKPNGALALEKYLARFGSNWVTQGQENNVAVVRLKTFAQYRPRLEEPGRFLLLPAAEISQNHGPIPVHVNATNLREEVKQQYGLSVLEVLQRCVSEVWRQRQATGQPMIPHVAHPNYGWAVTAEDLIALRGELFFELYNGHVGVPNGGDADHISMERMWDIVLAQRLRADQPPFWRLAVDDAHHYHRQSNQDCNAGRGWVRVRAAELTPAAIIAALEAGDFHASTGVALRDRRWESNRLSLEIEAEPGVHYTTQFIGTRRGFDPSSRPVPGRTEGTLRTSRLYSRDIGVVFAEEPGISPSYTCKGDELYVRAKVISTKPKANAVKLGETEAAWVQPVMPKVVAGKERR